MCVLCCLCTELVLEEDQSTFKPFRVLIKDEFSSYPGTEQHRELAWPALGEQPGTGQEQGSGSLNSISSEQAGMLLHTQELLWIQATGSESAAPCSKAEITSSCSNPIEKPIQERVSLIL